MLVLGLDSYVRLQSPRQDDLRFSLIGNNDMFYTM